MAKDFTLTQLVAAKTDLEADITKLLGRFEETYGVSIKGVGMVTTEGRCFLSREVEILFDINKD
jgi:hypothetical protein